MRLVQEDASAHATRGEQVRTITFGSESMTVMLALSEVDGGFRVDGWVAPGGTRHVEVRTAEGSSGLECDSTGRFTVPLVPPGHFQLVLDGDATGTGTGGRRRHRGRHRQGHDATGPAAGRGGRGPGPAARGPPRGRHARAHALSRAGLAVRTPGRPRRG